MVASITPDQMVERLQEFQGLVSYNVMSAAAAKALRPVRKQARRLNYGFTDRTRETRKLMGPIRRYKQNTARRYGGGGAYFRGPGIVGAMLEYRYGGKYKFLEPAMTSTRGDQFKIFTREANREIIKEARNLRNRGF